jgi:beta-glucosidase
VPAPAYPFGHGLGYTSWAYEELIALPPSAEADLASVTVRVRNVGPRAGREVVQLYLDGPQGRRLAGFRCVTAAPGDVAEAVIPVPRRAASTYHPGAAAWQLPAGPFELSTGPLTITLA